MCDLFYFSVVAGLVRNDIFAFHAVNLFTKSPIGILRCHLTIICLYILLRADASSEAPTIK